MLGDSSDNAAADTTMAGEIDGGGADAPTTGDAATVAAVEAIASRTAMTAASRSGNADLVGGASSSASSGPEVDHERTNPPLNGQRTVNGEASSSSSSDETENTTTTTITNSDLRSDHSGIRAEQQQRQGEDSEEEEDIVMEAVVLSDNEGDGRADEDDVEGDKGVEDDDDGVKEEGEMRLNEEGDDRKAESTTRRTEIDFSREELNEVCVKFISNGVEFTNVCLEINVNPCVPGFFQLSSMIIDPLLLGLETPYFRP